MYCSQQPQQLTLSDPLLELALRPFLQESSDRENGIDFPSPPEPTSPTSTTGSFPSETGEAPRNATVYSMMSVECLDSDDDFPSETELPQASSQQVFLAPKNRSPTFDPGTDSDADFPSETGDCSQADFPSETGIYLDREFPRETRACSDPEFLGDRMGRSPHNLTGKL